MSSEQPGEKKELVEQPNKSSEKQLSPELFRDARESQEAYLWRSAEIINKTLKEGDPFVKSEMMTDEKLPVGVRENIKQVVAQASLEGMLTARPQEWTEEDWQEFRHAISEHFIGEYSDSDGFDKTVRNRGFFRFNEAASSNRETYWNTLFFSFNTQEAREFAKKILDQKKVVLLGGGRSELGEELQAHGIYPESITNIDPFVENPKSGADKVLPMSASDEGLSEKLPRGYQDKVDEVWAEYSVPAYLQNEKDVRQLMTNIDMLLAPGGVARIWPIMVGGVASGDSALRRESLYESVRGLVEGQGYELVMYTACGRPGMNLIKPKEVFTEILTDEERIARVMGVLEE